MSASASIAFSSSAIAAFSYHPLVKFSTDVPCFTENFKICNASIKSGPMWFLCIVMVSLADEKTLSHGTAEPWIGRMSIARWKRVG